MKFLTCDRCHNDDRLVGQTYEGKVLCHTCQIELLEQVLAHARSVAAAAPFHLIEGLAGAISEYDKYRMEEDD